MIVKGANSVGMMVYRATTWKETPILLISFIGHVSVPTVTENVRNCIVL